jgi:hypothetical protein
MKNVWQYSCPWGMRHIPGGTTLLFPSHW